MGNLGVFVYESRSCVIHDAGCRTVVVITAFFLTCCIFLVVALTVAMVSRPFKLRFEPLLLCYAFRLCRCCWLHHHTSPINPATPTTATLSVQWAKATNKRNQRKAG